MNCLSRTMQHICQEIRIPLPSGLIAGKWWGPDDKRPIVALHGWQDNCGSFDRLIPHLPPHIPILALDFPGHGHSYRLPPGLPYHNSAGSIFIKTLMKYFNWSKISLMGHSLGAYISYFYTFSFPHEVDFLISFDTLPPITHPLKMKRVARSVEQFLKYDEMNNSTDEPPSYTFDEMVRRVHLGSKKSIAAECAKYILARNIAPSEKQPGKFYFKTDARVKVGPLEIPDASEIIKCGLNVTLPVFLYKTNDGSFYDSEELFTSACNSVRAASPDFQFYRIPGTHHVHLNQPEIFVGVLNKFIEKHYIEDRSCGGLKPEMKFLEDIQILENVKNKYSKL